MLRAYMDQAMHDAQYEILNDDQSFYGEIPGFEGVYANARSLEACRNKLEEVLEEWILVRISRGFNLPIAKDLELKVRKTS